MSTEPLIDESILEGIPDELIRPLLAISILESRTFTIEQHQQLIKEIDKFILPCHEIGGESLYYIRVQNRLYNRLYAMLDAQAGAQQIDPTAKASHADTNRWYVNIIYEDGRNEGVLVSYESTGLDTETMEEGTRPIVTKAGPGDL